jgi:hypothetical protein
MRLPKTRRGRTILSLVIAGELVSTALAWRDLARRTDDQVRGSKKFWRLIITINPGNSLAYWLLGRR